MTSASPGACAVPAHPKLFFAYLWYFGLQHQFRKTKKDHFHFAFGIPIPSSLCLSNTPNEFALLFFLVAFGLRQLRKAKKEYWQRKAWSRPCSWGPSIATSSKTRSCKGTSNTHVTYYYTYVPRLSLVWEALVSCAVPNFYHRFVSVKQLHYLISIRHRHLNTFLPLPLKVLFPCDVFASCAVDSFVAAVQQTLLVQSDGMFRVPILSQRTEGSPSTPSRCTTPVLRLPIGRSQARPCMFRDAVVAAAVALLAHSQGWSFLRFILWRGQPV